MKVHIFGGVSSPSCANYALKQTAEDNKEMFGEEISEVLQKDFYVDDLLKSCEDVEKAKWIVSNVVKLCKAGGFRLTKFISNNREVIESVPVEERVASVKSLDLLDSLPTERALGVNWSIETDNLGFQIVLQDKPPTKRGILSIISSINDPLRLAAPFMLQGKLIMQQLCKGKNEWDSPLQKEIEVQWESWKINLPQLQTISVPRCITPNDFENIESLSIHHFCDASTIAYGICSYSRVVSKNGEIHCSLLIGKSRVAPLKQITVPRMELVAATVAAKNSSLIKRELHNVKIDEEYFWTDSKVVLGYINNEAKRFHVFVANRIQMIHNLSKKSQWRYVPSVLNPADDASKGLLTTQIKKSNRWFNGPEFLWKIED